MQSHYIQDHQALVQLCQQIKDSPIIAIDTEFVRTRTLYPKLGLLQLCNGEHLALIDPIAIDDLSPFWQLLTNEHCCKVIHACSEDLEVFLSAANCKPVNLIDSQIMMAFLGHGLSMGYAAMVNHYTGIELDKSESRTDWIRRPLSEKQLTYAAADVEHLFNVYPKILAEITTSGWLMAAQQETQLLIDKKFTSLDIENLYRQVKFAWKLGPKQLSLLKSLTIWRIEQAQKRDLPIGFIAKDHTIIGLAKHDPKSVNEMLKIEGVEQLDIRHKGKAMLLVLNRANEIAEADYPQPIVRLDEYPGYKNSFKKVKAFIVSVADKSGLAPENLASKKQINQFLSHHYQMSTENSQNTVIDVLTGWRKMLFGDQLMNFAANGFQ